MMKLCPYVTYVLTVILVAVIPGRTSENVCDFDKSCLLIYNNIKSIYDDEGDGPEALPTLCTLSHDLKDCMRKTSRRCRGDLNYHFFEKLVKDLNALVGVSKNCASFPPSSSVVPKSDEASSSSSSSHHDLSHNNNNGEGGRRNRVKGGNGSGSTEYHSHHRHGNRNGASGGSSSGCVPKTFVDSSSSGSTSGEDDDPATAGCALFGLTNLKPFSEPLNHTEINYCSLAGAWNLIDTPEFAVQITNKGGLSPLPKDITATTLVTVFVKSNSCSGRKTYQATFDEVPGMFSDGYTTSGNVYIETVVESEHVKIHFPYIMTTIDVIKVLDKIPIPSLAVAIKMPEVSVKELMTEPKRLRGLPLCFYGCPRTAAMLRASGLSSAPTTATSGGSITARSTSNSYYKSNCPDPADFIVSDEGDYEDELPQGDDVKDPLPPPQHSRNHRKGVSRHISTEILRHHDGSINSFTHTDFGGQRSQRSSSANSNGGTAVICASLNSVYQVLEDTKVVGLKLPFPGDTKEEAAGSYSSRSTSLIVNSHSHILLFLAFLLLLNPGIR